MPPQVLHSMQFGGRPRQETQRQPSGFGMLATAAGGMRRSAIFKEHAMPATPLRADHSQDGLLGGLIPHIRHQQQDVATLDIDHPMENTTGMMPTHRHADLLPPPPVTVIQRWSLGDAGLIEHQHDGTDTGAEPAFEPPVAWRQVVGRRAKRCRGRFHRQPKRAMARLTLCLETVRSCSSQRYWVNSGAVHTVER